MRQPLSVLISVCLKYLKSHVKSLILCKCYLIKHLSLIIYGFECLRNYFRVLQLNPRWCWIGTETCNQTDNQAVLRVESREIGLQIVKVIFKFLLCVSIFLRTWLNVWTTTTTSTSTFTGGNHLFRKRKRSWIRLFGIWNYGPLDNLTVVAPWDLLLIIHFFLALAISLLHYIIKIAEMIER